VRRHDIGMRWYYSSRLKLYVDLDPLKLDKRVFDVCNALNIVYDYDTEKNIYNIDFDDSRKLLEGLGGQMLTLSQYWELYKEAVEKGNEELLESLTSGYFTEPLNRIYVSENEYIDNPQILSKYEYNKKSAEKHSYIEYRPGWFLPDENIDMQTGLPININKYKNAKTAEWKFWTPDLSVTKLEACFVLRGYVTSVGRPSLDLGIPVDSRQPKQMVRECRLKPLTASINADYLKQINTFLCNRGAKENDIKSIVSNNEWQQFLQNEDNEINIVKESLLDKIGIISCNGNNDDFKIINYSNFFAYMRQLKELLANNVYNQITFVIGHRNPDTDTVVSSILEAYRNTLLYPQNIYIPIIQSDTLPAEVRELLGEELSACLIYQDDKNYQKTLKQNFYSFIFVDHNYQQDAQKSVCKIIDHHEVSDIAKMQRIPKTLELIGSTTALVLLKYLGLNYNFAPEVLKTIYGAMLMDTENKVEHKMTAKDRQVFAFVEKRIDINSSDLYKKLSNKLISETNIETLFNRDYKDFYNYGFAVIKTKDEDIQRHIPKIMELAKANNANKAYPLTIIKIVIYNENIDVLKEIILFEKREHISEQLVVDVSEVIKKSLELSFKQVKFIENGNMLTFYNIGKQLSRKRISKAIENVVREYDGFVYMNSIKKWVSRDFLRMSTQIETKYSNIRNNSEGYVNYCNYSEAKELVENLGYGLLTLSEYWKVLEETKNAGDIRLEKSLKHNKYIEYLNTTSSNFNEIPEGSPSLFFEGEVDSDTGLPDNLLTPNHYGLPNTWRYWSNPDNDNIYVFTRSHIFLLDTPCLDAKTLEHESFPNLLIRPVSKESPAQKIVITGNENKLSIFKREPTTGEYELIYEGSNFTD
jgi:inorganic pyrophosphatase/exopolyphosphatase